MIGSNIPAQNDYVGNGTTSDFPITFPVWIETDIVVYVIRESDGVRLNLVITTDYSLNADFNELSLVDAAQEWVDAEGDLKTGYTLFIEFTDEAYQPGKFTDLGRTAPIKFEGSVDRLAMFVKAVALKASRALSLSGGSGFEEELPPMVGQAGKLLKVNDDENGFDYGPTYQDIIDAKTDAQAAATAAATSETNAATSEANAETYKDQAQAAKADAEAAETGAANSASAASSSESNAAISEAEAEQWAKYYAFTNIITIDFTDSPYTIDYITDADAMIQVDTSLGNVVINLPSLGGMPDPDWKVGVAKRTGDVNTVTINPFAGQTINGSAGVLLTDTRFGIAFADDTPSNWDGAYIAFGAFTGDSGGSLPSGGTADQILVKNSAIDGDASWKDDPSIVNALIFG